MTATHATDTLLTDADTRPVDEDGEPRPMLAGSVSTDPVYDYLRSLSRTPLLTAEQEVDLAKRIEAGVLAQERLDLANNCGPALTVKLRRELAWLAADGATAKAHMVEANLRLVVSIAKRYTGRGLSFVDLLQEGNLGLIRAVEKFDYLKGYKFSTYATWWIRQAVSRALADQSRTIRLPVHTVDALSAIRRARVTLTAELGHEPTVEEVAAAAGMTAAKVQTLLRHAQTPVSLHTPMGEGGDELAMALVDPLETPTEDVIAAHQLGADLHAALSCLRGQGGHVLRLRYGLVDGTTYTCTQVAEQIGLSRERVRQIELAALKRLRSATGVQHLRDYLT